jgi:hypothetical protein
LVNELYVGHPIVGETPKVGNDEIELWILWS